MFLGAANDEFGRTLDSGCVGFGGDESESDVFVGWGASVAAPGASVGVEWSCGQVLI